ncbi:MAG: hypothetical protein ACOVQY_11690 [Erythrobacter sp.]
MPQAHFLSRRSGLPLLAGLGALALGLAAPVLGGTINSNLQIEPGKTFELGGGQEGAFTVTGRNSGPVAVEVLGRAEGSAQAQVRGTVAPGGEVKASFAEGEMALLRNTSATRMARLKLKISGDTSALGMSYSDNPE